MEIGEGEEIHPHPYFVLCSTTFSITLSYLPMYFGLTCTCAFIILEWITTWICSESNCKACVFLSAKTCSNTPVHWTMSTNMWCTLLQIMTFIGSKNIHGDISTVWLYSLLICEWGQTEMLKCSRTLLQNGLFGKCHTFFFFYQLGYSTHKEQLLSIYNVPTPVLSLTIISFLFPVLSIF